MKTTDQIGDWAIHNDIFPEKSDHIVQKKKCDSFHNTTLDETLKKLHVEKMIYVGMQTEFCIDTICRRSFSMGYEGVLIS